MLRKTVASLLPAFLPLSNRHQTPHAVGFHRSAGAALYDSAAGHHQIVIRKPGGEIVKLLHQQNGHIAAGGWRAPGR